MVLAESVELKPPPLNWSGGSSSVVPCAVAEPPPVSSTVTGPEVRGRRSAVPEGEGKVVRSPMRKRRRVTVPPELFVNLRRNESVPKVELFAGSLVKSRP